MRVLIFDTETSGFPSPKKPSSDPCQARLIELAFFVLNEDIVEEPWQSIVQCPVDVGLGAENVHGISKAKSMAEGIPVRAAVEKFDYELQRCDRYVCHNVLFDQKIMDVAYFHADMSPDALYTIPNVCTLKSTTQICKLTQRHRSGYKWPSLAEAYAHLVNPDGFSGAHRADADARACLDIYLALISGNHPLVSA